MDFGKYLIEDLIKAHVFFGNEYVCDGDSRTIQPLKDGNRVNFSGDSNQPV